MHDMASVWTREARQTWRADLCLGAVVLRGFAVPEATAIVTALHGITTHAACHWLTATWWSGGARQTALSRHHAAQGGTSPLDGRTPHQSDIPQGGLIATQMRQKPHVQARLGVPDTA